MPFKEYQTYRNDYGHTLDIFIEKIYYIEEEYVKLKIAYIFRTSGEKFFKTDHVKILAKDYKNWYIIK